MLPCTDVILVLVNEYSLVWEKSSQVPYYQLKWVHHNADKRKQLEKVILTNVFFKLHSLFIA